MGSEAEKIKERIDKFKKDKELGWQGWEEAWDKKIDKSKI